MINDKLELDLAPVNSPQSLHEILAIALRFPDYYGKNWDAFWDCIRDPEQSSMPKNLVLKGFGHLDKTMPYDALQLRRCLIDLKNERPEIEVMIS